MSLVGTLQHATKAVRPGKTFVSRMYLTAAKLKKLHFITRLNKAFKSDLLWWHIFLHSWNGFSILHHPTPLITPDFVAQMDASGTWGCTAVLGSRWFQWQWPSEWLGAGIMARSWFQSSSPVSLGDLCYITVTSIFSVITKAWLLLSAKAPQRHYCDAPSMFSMAFHRIL